MLVSLARERRVVAHEAVAFHVRVRVTPLMAYEQQTTQIHCTGVIVRCGSGVGRVGVRYEKISSIEPHPPLSETRNVLSLPRSLPNKVKNIKQ